MPAEELDVDTEQTHSAARFKTVGGATFQPSLSLPRLRLGGRLAPSIWKPLLDKNHKKSPENLYRSRGLDSFKFWKAYSTVPPAPRPSRVKKPNQKYRSPNQFMSALCLTHIFAARVGGRILELWRDSIAATVQSLKSRGVGEQPTWSVVVAEHFHPLADCDDTRVRSRTIPHSVLDRRNFHCGGLPNGPIRGSRYC